MKLIRFATVDQQVMAIACSAGRIYTQLVWIDSPVRAHKVANGDVERYGSAVESPTLKQAARTMLKAGKKLGITKKAKKLLREAL